MSLSVAIRHSFGSFDLDVAFEAPAGVTALFGRSGSGKTSVVNAIAGLLVPHGGRIVAEGTVLLDRAQGICLPPHRRRIGYVFQDARLFPHLTVRQNLKFGAFFAPRAALRADFDHVVGLLGIDHLLDRRPGRLSGGERQRVAIGRALLAAPRVLLLDEPLAALDEARKEEILPHLERLRDETRVPIVYVSHSVAEVRRLATTVVALGEGSVERIGTADLAVGPAARILAGAGEREGEREGVLAGRLVAQREDGASEVLTAGGSLLVPRIPAEPGTPVLLAVRAEDLTLAAQAPDGLDVAGVLACTLARIGPPADPWTAVSLACGEARLSARASRRALARLGLAAGAPCLAVVRQASVVRVGSDRADAGRASARS